MSAAPGVAADLSAGGAAVLSSETCDRTLRIAGMSCAACQSHVQRALASVPGVQEATVDLLTHTARVTAAPTLPQDALTTAVRRAGYELLTPEAHDATGAAAATAAKADPSAIVEPGQETLGLRALLALLAGTLAMALSMPLMQAGAQTHADVLSHASMRLLMPLLPGWLMTTSPNLLRCLLFGLSLATMLFAAPEIYRAAWRAARHRATNMNTLVALGTLIAFAASTYATVSLLIGRASKNFSDVYFEAVMLILAFLLAGRWLEGRARQRATRSLRAFAHTESGTVRWVGEGAPPELETGPDALLNAPETLLPLDAVAVGDLFRLLPGDRIPLDGIVLAGQSSVDESMLTGEPLPVARAAGDKLYSGTLNLDGALLLRATALGADSMQAQIARLLERARATRAPLQRMADRVSAVFVPTVLALAGLTFLVWVVLDNSGSHHLGFGRALSLAIAVLVVACPCAMGLAVPAAVAVSLGAAARGGILIKGGEALERLAAIDRVAFDKTGTLTEGRPEIIAFQPEPGTPYNEDEMLRWALAVEQLSTHPLATAVRRYAAERGIAQDGTAVTDARVVPGLGVRGVIDGRQISIGSARLIGSQPVSNNSPLPEDLDHATALYLFVDGTPAASFSATDTLRASATAAVAQLKQLGLAPLLLTGDRKNVARRLADQAGIEISYAEQLPAEKLTVIEQIQHGGERIAMVGDGINDAAALARADAGIAVASGTDLAREAGHVLLLHHDLRLVPAAIRLARRTRRLMRQNLAWALVYNLLGIPLAAGVLLPHFGLSLSPAFASAAMALSSVSVLLNSLRLARAPAVYESPKR